MHEAGVMRRVRDPLRADRRMCAPLVTAPFAWRVTPRQARASTSHPFRTMVRASFARPQRSASEFTLESVSSSACVDRAMRKAFSGARRRSCSNELSAPSTAALRRKASLTAPISARVASSSRSRLPWNRMPPA